MSTGSEGHTEEKIEPNLRQARQTAHVSHGVVVKFQEMGLPQAFDAELAALSSDLGDLWSAQKTLADNLEGFLKSPHDWEVVGDHLVDLRASIDHIAWHLKSVRRPLNRITQFAYRKALGSEKSKDDGPDSP